MEHNHNLAHKLAELFAELPQVEAVALGGSQAGGMTDAASDIDLYVYTRADIPVETRRGIVARAGGASHASLGLNFWGPGDEWLNAASGIEVDVVYFDAGWMESQIRRVIHEHQASLGYTTCFWHTVRASQVLYDPHGWMAALQSACRVEYPEPLRRNIIALNHPVLREVIPAYYGQIQKAVKRRDLVSINHRLAALLASYFDILFALNRLPHPGEKRLVQFALERCEKLPEGMQEDIAIVIQASAGLEPGLLAGLDRLLDRLDEILRQEGFGAGPNGAGVI
jgi:hypothetical protein